MFIANHQVFRGTYNGASFEVAFGDYPHATVGYVRRRVRVDAKKKAVETVADQMTIELPLPLDSVV